MVFHSIVEKSNTVRNKPDDGTGSGLTELKSQYKLNYETVTASTTGRIQVTADDGSTTYVLPKREGGPSLTEYPIGTFYRRLYICCIYSR